MFSNSYTFNKEHNIWVSKNNCISYSDGDSAENLTYETLKKVYDKSVFSKELVKVQTNWVTTYHYSAFRSNILRPFEEHLKSGKRVLELGCGCGAITRYLGECGASVIAVEGSMRRAITASCRCKGLSNIEFIVDNIENLSKEKIGTFDVITLIGVFEYARKYCGGQGAEHKILELVYSLLSDNGVLILAIENKLGLKYFAGAPEDHIGVRFASVCNAYNKDGIVTYSRKELLKLFSFAGFSKFEQYIPFPDYKLPQTIITPFGLEEEKINLSSLCYASNKYETMPLFNMQNAWQSVCTAGLLPELANSLCFAVYKNKHAPTIFESEKVLAEHYSLVPTNPKQYAKKVQIIEDSSQISCKKRYLFENVKREEKNIKHILEDEPYYHGGLLIDKIRQNLLMPNWTLQHILHGFIAYANFLKNSAIANCDKGSLYLLPNCLDLTPFNIIVDDKGVFTAFDLEWQANENISMEMVFYRGVVLTLYKMGTVAKPSEEGLLNFSVLLQEIGKSCGFEYSEEYIKNMLTTENILDKHLFGQIPDWQVIKNRQLSYVEF